MYITISKLHRTDFQNQNVITNTCNYKINHTYEEKIKS